VYIQGDSPGADKESNWLPCAPSGPIDVTIRVYQPNETMIDGTFKIPPIKKVSGNVTNLVNYNRVATVATAVGQAGTKLTGATANMTNAAKSIIKP
jgi:hypothetical protein